MSDEQEKKEGIVVHPQFDKAAEPGNVGGSSEGTSGDQASQESQSESETSSQSNQTAATDTSASDVSQQSNEGQALGNVASGTSTETGASDTSAQGSDGVAPGNVTGAVTDSSNSQASGVSPTNTATAPSLAQGTLPPQGSIPPVAILGGTVISSVLTPPPAPAPAPTPTPVSTPPAPGFIQTGISDVDQIVENLMKDTSTEAKIVINTIKEYLLAMKPGKPLTVKQGTAYQVSFYNALLTAINKIEKDFRPTMQSILALLHAHKDGAFRETHVFRFIEHVQLSSEHRMGFRKITTLLKTLANPATRQDLLRQMNFDPLLKYGLTERGRTKLAAFFGK
jgi:hypothetical protein